MLSSYLLLARRSAVLLGVCSVGLGCQLIAGIEKAEVDPTFDPGDPNGSGGKSTGSGGNGSGGGADIVGVKFSSDSCSTDVALTESHLVSCLMRVSCDPWSPSFTISDCLTLDVQGAWESESCALGATSCDEVQSCIGREFAEADDLALCAGTCRDTSLGEYCQGTCQGTCMGNCDGVMDTTECNGFCDDLCIGTCCDGGGPWVCDTSGESIYCGGADLNDYPSKIDCTSNDAYCYQSSNTSALSFGCEPIDAIDCTTDSDTYLCSGDDTIYSCVEGYAKGWQCPEGMQCVMSDTYGAYCSDVPANCTDTLTSYCEGDTLQFCTEDGILNSFECSTAGLNCEEDSYANCVASGCAVDEPCQEGCADATTLTVCVGGAELEVDCTAFGFSTCVESSDSGDFPVARCLEALDTVEPGPGPGPAPDPSDGIPRDNSCIYSFNNVCDEVDGTCEVGTDIDDCYDTCATSHNGQCEESTTCGLYTDDTDCGYNKLPSPPSP